MKLTLIKQDFLYFLYSKKMYIFILLGLILMLAPIFVNWINLNILTDEVNRNIVFYYESGFTLEEAFSQGFVYEVLPDGSYLIENPLLFNLARAQGILDSMSLQNLMGTILEFSSASFPFLFGIVGVAFAQKDLKNNMLKVRGVRFNRENLLISKSVSLFLITTMLLLCSFILAFLTSYLFSSFLKLPFDFPMYQVDNIFYFSPPNIIQFIFPWLLSLLYSFIGFGLFNVLSNGFAALVIIIGYSYIMPNLGRFSLNNSVSYISNKVFDYNATIVMLEQYETNILLSLLVIIFILALSLLSVLYAWSKKSMYSF